MSDDREEEYAVNTQAEAEAHEATEAEANAEEAEREHIEAIATSHVEALDKYFREEAARTLAGYFYTSTTRACDIIPLNETEQDPSRTAEAAEAEANAEEAEREHIEAMFRARWGYAAPTKDVHMDLGHDTKPTSVLVAGEDSTIRMQADFGYRDYSDSIKFTFIVNGETMEMIRLCPNGDIFVKGKLTKNDKEIVHAIREFMQSTTIDTLPQEFLAVSGPPVPGETPEEAAEKWVDEHGADVPDPDKSFLAGVQWARGQK